MTETQMLALLALIDSKIALAIAQSKGHIKPVSDELHIAVETNKEILWEIMNHANRKPFSVM